MRLLGVLAALVLVLGGVTWFLLRQEGTPAGTDPSAPANPASGAAPRPLAPADAAPAPARSEPVPVATAPRPGVIRGSVRDDHGVPLHEEVQVVALDADGEVVASTRVDASGDFELSSFGLAAVRIEPRKEGWFARESPPIAGLSGEVRLVLERGGKIAGSLVLDPVRGSLGAYVRATGADDHARQRLGEIRPDGSFEIDGLDRGEHDFELVGDGSGMPVGALFRIPGVIVRRGATTRDPRLEALVLDALVRAVQVTVVDPEGALVGGATVLVLEREGGVLGRAALERELLSLPVPLDRVVDALVVHAGYRPALVTLDLPYATVVLARGIRVFLRPTRPLQLDRGSVGAFLRLRPELPELETWPEGVCDVVLPMSFGSEPATEVVFPFPGHYRLHVALLERIGSTFGGTPGARFAALDEGFDVFERDAGQRRDFWMPPDLFEQVERAARAR